MVDNIPRWTESAIAVLIIKRKQELNNTTTEIRGNEVAQLVEALPSIPDGVIGIFH